MDYLLHVTTLVLIYVALAASLNLLAGYGGLLSICHGAFFGIGAYSVAILCTESDWSWFLAVCFGIGVASVAAAGIGYVSLRFRDDYFVIATFGFQMVIFSLMQNWITLTRGPMGIVGIPRPLLLGITFESHSEFLVLVLVYAAMILEIARRLSLSPLGRALKAIREDEKFAVALAKNVANIKTSIFILTACMAAGAGGLFASLISYVDPNSFTVMESILILAIVIIGGAGSVWGPVLGSLILIAFPEALRFVGLPSSVAANLRLIIYGTALVACMMWRPQGLMGEFSFRQNESTLAARAVKQKDKT